MKTFLFSFFMSALLWGSQHAYADQFKVAADSSSGTYQRMLGEIIAQCNSDDLEIVQAPGVTGGAPGNLDALVNNKAQAAFLHSDVYFSQAQADPSYNKFQTLVALYPEPIHVLTLRVSKMKKKGWSSFGTQDINSLADAAGYEIGAAGGGVFTAKILQGTGQGGFTVAAFGTGDDVIRALNNGDVAAAIFVGAAPLPNIEKLNKMTYKLIPIGSSIADRVGNVYRVTSINYPGLTNGPLKTLAPWATILTRKYSTPDRIKVQREFRQCFYQHLDALRDDGSPNWQSVDASDHGVLPWYEIPDDTAQSAQARRK